MTIWLDNHLSPALARGLSTVLERHCTQIRDLGMARASDLSIFRAARNAGVTAILTKDRDFAELAVRLGRPPSIILLTMGNTSTGRLLDGLRHALPAALRLADDGEPLIEIGPALGGG